MKWTDSVVLISGASRGIGAEVARHAARKGARLGLMARSAGDLEALKAELGATVAITTADVTSRASVEAAVTQLESELGPTDILVNNAGVGLYGAFLDADVADIERQVQTNYLGGVYLLKAVVPGMVARRRGHVVTMGSIAGRLGSPFEAAYTASKFAQVGLAEAIAIELAPYGVRSSIINPGPVATPFGEARGHPYDRKSPKPLPVEVVAKAVITAVERNQSELFLPHSLRPAVVIRWLMSPAFRIGTAKAFTKELAADRSQR